MRANFNYMVCVSPSYKSLAQMPTHRNGPVSSNVRPHREKSCQSQFRKQPKYFRAGSISKARFRSMAPKCSLQQRQIARSVHAIAPERLINVQLPVVALRGQQNLSSSSHRLSSSSSKARVCNQVASDTLQAHHASQPWVQLAIFIRSVNRFVAFLAAGGNFQVQAVWPNPSLNRTHCGGHASVNSRYRLWLQQCKSQCKFKLPNATTCHS